MSSVDVIVPCYGYGQFLRECVESVLAQSIENLHILIIDDASPDNTLEVAVDLVKDSRVSYSRHNTNKGHIYTYNEGIDWASSDYMMILSADDYLLPGSLGRAVALMDAHRDVGLTFGGAIELHEDGTTSLPERVLDLDTNVGWSILGASEFLEISGADNIVRTPTAVVRTQLQKKLGGYRYELPHSGDMEMWLRFASAARIGVLGEYQAVYRRHRGNMSRGYTRLPDLQQRKAALDIFFKSSADSLPGADGLRRKLFWLLACESVRAASGAFNEGAVAVSQQLAEFAIHVCPEVVRSTPWITLVCKRILGLRVCNALRSAIGKPVMRAALDH